ncbi:MAG: polysaccharide deacetylase family protein [Elusimicrobia bacterium]|nr:polysaccharide deacetylase family protein [Elusimicrobiota bacterium]
MNSVPILLYHHISYDREITPDGFFQQLVFLKKTGYETIFLNQLPCFTKKVKKSVVITFDDGFVDNWIYAFPILKKLNMKATIFVTTSYIDDGLVRQNYDDNSEIKLDTLKNEKDKKYFLNWQELKIMYKSGLIDIQSHTNTHKNFNKYNEYENIEEEIKVSKNIIEKNLNKECGFICWPWGKYRKNWVDIAKNNGYTGCVTTRVGANTEKTNPYEIKRFKIEKENIDWFSNRVSLCSNKMIVNLYGLVFGLDRKVKNIFNEYRTYN